MPGEQFTVDHGRVNIRYMSLERLIVRAYGIKRYQLTGADWMASAPLDIQAEMPERASSLQVPEMLQALLAERFHLALNREKKELPVYALLVEKNGAKLEPGMETSGQAPEPPGSRPLYTPEGEARMTAKAGAEIVSGPYGPARMSPPGDPAPHLDLLAITMPAFAEVIAPHKDRPVVDMTGLTGRYHIPVALDLLPGSEGRRRGEASDAAAPAPPSDPFVDGLNAALKKAGLRLEKQMAPVETIVIDRLEKLPTAN